LTLFLLKETYSVRKSKTSLNPRLFCIFATRMWCLFMKSIFWTYEAFTVNDCKTEVKQSSVKQNKDKIKK